MQWWFRQRDRLQPEVLPVVAGSPISEPIAVDVPASFAEQPYPELATAGDDPREEVIHQKGRRAGART